MPTLLLYRFRYFDPITQRMRQARYVAEEHEIKARYERYELLGEPEHREIPDKAQIGTPGDYYNRSPRATLNISPKAVAAPLPAIKDRPNS